MPMGASTLSRACSRLRTRGTSPRHLSAGFRRENECFVRESRLFPLSGAPTDVQARLRRGHRASGNGAPARRNGQRDGTGSASGKRIRPKDGGGQSGPGHVRPARSRASPATSRYTRCDTTTLGLAVSPLRWPYPFAITRGQLGTEPEALKETRVIEAPIPTTTHDRLQHTCGYPMDTPHDVPGLAERLGGVNGQADRPVPTGILSGLAAAALAATNALFRIPDSRKEHRMRT